MYPEKIYLDYNASAPVRPEAVCALSDALAEGGNAASVHWAGRHAKRRIESARTTLAFFLGTAPETLIFTSGGTEADNLALTGPVGAGLVDSLIIGATEHDAVRAPAARLGLPIQTVRVQADGRPDLDHLSELLDQHGADGLRPLVSIMHANNETGVIAPMGDIVSLVRDKTGGLVHTDAVQSAGRLPLDLTLLGVDLLTISGHKLGGPPGTGVLAVREGLALTPLIEGGGQELGRRSGTENHAAIAGLAAAVTGLQAQGDMDAQDRLADWRDGFEAGIRAVAPEAVVFGSDAPRLANTSCFAVPGLSGETQVMALDLAGVAVSSGAACSSGKVAPSHVLAAMGAGADVAGSAIRVSLGWASQKNDLDRCLEAWSAHFTRWQKRRPSAVPPHQERRVASTL